MKKSRDDKEERVIRVKMKGRVWDNGEGGVRDKGVVSVKCGDVMRVRLGWGLGHGWGLG